MPTKDVATYAERDPLEAVKSELAVIVAGTVKDGFKTQQGDVVGVISASSLLRRRSRTTATGTGFITTSPTGQVTDASVFAAGDVLKDGNGATIGTVQTVNTIANPNTVTLTANAAVAVAAAAAVLGSDGSQVAQGIADDETDGVGDTPINVYIAGCLKLAKLRGLDASAKAELSGASRVGGIFRF